MAVRCLPVCMLLMRLVGVPSVLEFCQSSLLHAGNHRIQVPPAGKFWATGDLA